MGYMEDVQRPYSALPGQSSNLNSLGRAAANTFKAYIGSGILSLPFAFSNAGLWGGIITFPILGILSAHCMFLLVDCKKGLLEKGHDVTLFADVGRLITGRIGAFLVNLALISSQAGFCCAYVIFIGKNLHLMIPQLSFYECALIAVIPLLLLCYLRNLRLIAPFSLIANFLICFGLWLIVCYALPAAINTSYASLQAFNWRSFPLFLSVTIYSYEGIGLVLPVESTMEEPSKFKRMLGVVLFFVTILYIGVGAIGYVAFGPELQDVITANMPTTAWTTLMKIFLCLALLMTYPSQMFPVFEIMEKWHGAWSELSQLDDENHPLLLENKDGTSNVKRRRLYLYSKIYVSRTLVVLVTCGVAIGIPAFSLLISLIGSLCCSPLAFIFPTLFHLKLFWGRLSKIVIIKNIIILLFGVGVLIFSTYMTLVDMIHTLKQGIPQGE